MSRGSLHSVLHEDKLPLEWNTRLNIVSKADSHSNSFIDVCCQIKDVGKGMTFLHSHQVLHRHLTPSNILIGEHFNAKLNDFVSLSKSCPI